VSSTLSRVPRQKTRGADSGEFEAAVFCRSVTPLVVSISALGACANTEFKPFDAKDNVFQGRGGTKVVVDGMEIWDNGEWMSKEGREGDVILVKGSQRIRRERDPS